MLQNLIENDKIYQSPRVFHYLNNHYAYQISGCGTEKDVDYWGNDVSSGEQPNVAACRSSCRSKGAGFFTYTPNNRACYCKNSDAGRKHTGGAESGGTLCTGKLSFHRSLSFQVQPTVWDTLHYINFL